MGFGVIDMAWARLNSVRLAGGLLLLAIVGMTPARAQDAQACDALPPFEIVDREWISDAHREAVAALGMPLGPDRAGALAAAATTMEALAGDVERSHGRGATLAMARADWAMIAQEADSQTYAGPAAAELKQSFSVLLEAARTRTEADYLLYLIGAAEVATAEAEAAIARHRAVAGADGRQLSALAGHVKRTSPEAGDALALGRLMRSIAAELQSGRGLYEADALLLRALLDTGDQDGAAAVAAALAPDAIARLERVRARIDADGGGGFDPGCWAGDDVVAGITEAVADVAGRADLEDLLFWEGMEIAFFADTETDYTGASFGFAELLALKALGDTRYRELLRSYALAHPHSNMAYAFETGAALSGGEVFASMLIPEIAAEFYSDAKQWSETGSDTTPAVRFEVLLRVLRFEWTAGNTASVDGTMAEAGGLIRSHGSDINPILRTLYHVLEAEILEARLEDDAAAEALARAIATNLAEIPEPFARRSGVLDTLPHVERLLADHLSGTFCTGCAATLAKPLSAWWAGRVAHAHEDPGAGETLANLALEIWLSDAPAAAGLKTSARAELERGVEEFARSQSYKSGIDRLLAQVDKTDLATIAPLAGEWWMAAEVFTEANPDRMRDLVRRSVENNASLAYELGGTIGFFTDLDRYARRAARAGHGQLARNLFEEMLRLSEPGHGLAEHEWYEPDEHARLQLARELAPAYARRARDAFGNGDIAAANIALDKAMDLMTRRLAQEWRAGNEQAALLFRQFRSALHLSAQLRFLLALSPQAAERLPGIRDRAFADMQMAMLGETALTMQSSIRNRIVEDDALREAIAQRDEAIDRLRRLETVEAAISSRLPWAVDETRARTDAEIEAASAAVAERLTISEDFTALEPLTPAQVTEALRPSEAVAVFHAGTSTLYGFILRPGHESFMYTVRVGREELTGRIARLRQDASGFGAVDLANAAALHEALLGPAMEALAGVDHLVVVADGPLPGLPWAMLVAGEPSGAIVADAVQAASRGAVSLASPGEAASAVDWSAQPWLIRQFPVSVAPSVASLVAQRAAIGGSRAAHPFLGVGDPVLRGGRAVESVEIASLFTRSGEIDLAALADLAPLPETAHELARLAEVLGATPDSLLLGQRATESELKARPLSDYRVVAFATHGILAGEVAGTVEPGLVLTPETAGEAGNDGYLALSEIMALRLDADLVILSACNTGGADGRPRAEWMSGLARGFISAGARRMLVTLWSIPSDPTTRLITGTAAAHAELSDWPKALRASVVAMIDEPAQAVDAHPASWAGFVMLGVGG